MPFRCTRSLAPQSWMARMTRPRLNGSLAGVLIAFVSCSRIQVREPSVVIYVSEDQVFAEPILQDFQKETGIAVKTVFDTEEAKSTGVMNRLIAEKDNPQADVYWANEPIRAELLKQRRIAAPYLSPVAGTIPAEFKDPAGYWTGFSARARVFIVRKGLADKPRSIRDYADPRWKGRAVIANPLFGTTTAEIAALFTAWGDAEGKRFLEALAHNDVKVSTSNGESAGFVASGEADFGLVDSDDSHNLIKRGEAVEEIYPDQGDGGLGTFIVPNAVLLIQGCSHPAQARQLIDYLLSPDTERKLAFADCAQIPLHPNVETPDEVPRIATLKTMHVEYADVSRTLQQIQPLLKEWTGH